MSTNSTIDSDPQNPPLGPPSNPPVSTQPSNRTFHRSRDRKVLGGVAGGLSETFGIDAVIIRIAFVVLATMGGGGFLAYFAAWVLLPKADKDSTIVSRRRDTRLGNLDGHQLLAIALVGIGVVALFDRMGVSFNGDLLLPFVLIGIGAAVLMSSKSNQPNDAIVTPNHRVSPVAEQPKSSGVGGSSWTEVDDSITAEAISAIDEFDRLRAPRAHEFEAGPLLSAALVTPLNFATATVASASSTQPTQRTSRRARRLARRSTFARSSFGSLLVSFGVLFALSRTGLINGRIDHVLAYALFILGAFLVVGAKFGRPRGFIALGVVATSVLGLLSLSNTTWRGGFGERFVTPTSLDQISDHYNLAGGAMHLDFSKVTFTGKPKVVVVEVSAGALAIELPENVRVVATTSSGVGQVTLFGVRSSGTSVTRKQTFAPSTESAGTIELRAHVGFGALEIARKGKLVSLTDLAMNTTNRAYPVGQALQ